MRTPQVPALEGMTPLGARKQIRCPKCQRLITMMNQWRTNAACMGCTTKTQDNPHGYIFAEQGSTEWDTAWEALIATGANPEKFMLMHGEPTGDQVVWNFKHIDTREYTPVVVAA